jgi:ribonuclease HII
MDVICGVDEAGRGPLAGPVTAAAVILPDNFPKKHLNDSKVLSKAQRKRIADMIKQQAVSWSVGWSWPEEIDKYNIHYATLLAMQRALNTLTLKPDLVYIDGKYAPQINLNCQTVVKGDSFIPVVQAASIMAKTQRDLWMERFGRIETQYLFEKHKGYPTLEHRKRLQYFGISSIHRKSFRVSSTHFDKEESLV